MERDNVVEPQAVGDVHRADSGADEGTSDRASRRIGRRSDSSNGRTKAQWPVHRAVVAIGVPIAAVWLLSATLFGSWTGQGSRTTHSLIPGSVQEVAFEDSLEATPVAPFLPHARSAVPAHPGRGGGAEQDFGQSGRSDAVTTVSGTGAAPPIVQPSFIDALAWVCDLGGDRAVLLDQDLLERASVAVPCPVRIRARADVSAWVVLSRTCGPLGRHDLALVRPTGAVGRMAAIGPVRDLECLDGGDALVVEGDWTQTTTRVLRAHRDGAVRQLAVWNGAVAVAGTGDRVFVGTMSGEGLLFDAGVVNGSPLARVALGAEISDVAPAEGGGWWVLSAASGSRLWRVDEHLNVVFERNLGGTIEDLAPTRVGAGADELLWMPRGSEPWLLVVDGNGRTVHDVDVTRIGPFRRGDGLADGGALFVASGSVLRVGAGGALIAAQGGFHGLQDVSVVPRP